VHAARASARASRLGGLKPAPRFYVLAALLLSAMPRFAQTLTINDDNAVYAQGVPFTISGTAAPNTQITVTIDNVGKGQTTANAAGRWELVWTAPMKTGTYDLTVSDGTSTATQILRVQAGDNVARQPGFDVTPRYGAVEMPNAEAVQEMVDRWRIAPPPYELDEAAAARRVPGRLGDRGATLDPYHQNLLKGDLPIFGKDKFLVLTGISDTLVESRAVPTPSNPSAGRPQSFTFFGENDQGVFVQNLILSVDLFQGFTAFQPVKQRLKATAIGNFNFVRVEEPGILKPDVRRGVERKDSHFALQELFYERLLKVLSTNYDFMSIRVGSQPFTSDFRGFIFSDTNLGVRFFGNLRNNRYQYNAAFFERLEKDTNSGLNRLTELRDQRVLVGNFYMQDFLGKRGYTQQFSIHAFQDDATFKFDRNGILVRPAPVGVFTPHEIEAVYLGESAIGHFGRINVDHAAYWVVGRDSLNPIAGPDPRLRPGDDDEIDISAGFFAIEASFDKDWLRPRIGFLYATGDDDPRDRTGTGFDSIFDAPNFAGGGFSFFNRLGIRLAGTGVALVERGSLFTSLRSSKDEGQPNYVNPGVALLTTGLDVEVTPRLKAIFTGNYIRFATTAPVEQLLFQGDIDKELGYDLSVGLRYRPFLSNNVVIVGGAAGFIPGRGFKDIYENGDPLYHVFTNLILQF
jgi:flagellar basal body rod protein FlgC